MLLSRDYLAPDFCVDAYFFKTLNEHYEDNEQERQNNIDIDVSDDDEFLNSSITEGEILNCIKSLKSNKSSSNDRILNEYIKHTSHIMLPVYVTFFNLVFDTGILPDAWLEGIIRPIYKNNGDPKLPENYRPITILSCFGKLFTAILNNRLNTFLQYHDLLEENQAGFRAGYSTTDHIFTLHTLTEILKVKRKKLYCSFIDFSKAFDSVWRVGLWTKLLTDSINGKMFRTIYNLYQNIKSCVIYSGKQSNFFNSYCGVRQGENLSPVLFSLFLNDLEEFLDTRHRSGINFNITDNEINVYLKILVLLYADDTVIFGTDAESFQHNLDMFYEYCQLWKLNVNYNKTKIMVFRLRNTQNLELKLGEYVISICDEFKYLGVIFSKSRSFLKAIKHNVDHAKKAMHLLYKRIRNLHIPIDLQIELFNHTIMPILLYGCEVWGFQNIKLIENVQNQFLRSITKLRKSTPLYIIYAELGITPIEIHVKSRMIGFWLSIINSENSKFSKITYNIMFNDASQGHNYKWLNHIRQILISTGRYELLSKTFIDNPKAVKVKITQTLTDLYVQEWHTKVVVSSKGRNYNIFKDNLNFEPYLKILPKNAYIPIIKYRTANHKLPVETGRWENTPYRERKCILCNKNDTGDEFHYLFICPFFMKERCDLLKPYYYRRPNILKYKDLLTSRNKNILLNLAKFVKIIMNKFS